MQYMTKDVISTAQTLLQYADAAYHNDRKLIDFTRDCGCNKLVPFETPPFVDGLPLGLRGYVALHGSNVILSFRGSLLDLNDWRKITLTTANWIINLAFNQAQHPVLGYRVHGGYATAVNAIFESVRSSIYEVWPSDGGYCWVTGHSLGGAIGSLMAPSLAESGIPVAGIYTFGSPRVGDILYAEKYPLPHFRFENRHDLVPHLPPPPSIVALGQAMLAEPLEQLEELLHSGLTFIARIDEELAYMVNDVFGGFIRFIREALNIQYKHTGMLHYFDEDGDLITPDFIGEELFEEDDFMGMLFDILDIDPSELQTELQHMTQVATDIRRLITFLGQIIDDLGNQRLSFLGDHNLSQYREKLSGHAG